MAATFSMGLEEHKQNIGAASSVRRKPLRVLFLHDHLGYSGGSIHGVTTYFLSILPAFNRNHVEPLLCIHRERHPAAVFLETAGIRPIFLGYRKWDPCVLGDLVRLIRDQRIDVLHLTGMKGILFGRIAARLTHRPAIIHFHDTNPAWPALLQRWLIRWTRWVLANSETSRQFAIWHYAVPPQKSEVLHYGIVPERFQQQDETVRHRIRAELDIPDAALVIGMVGRLIAEKGQQVLLRAMQKILAQCPEARLLIVGDGPTRSQCERLSGMLGLTNAVRFTGHRKDIANLLCAIDVVCVPSLWEEAFGYVALEALCASRPVVASRVGGLPEIVLDGKTGILVPRGDVEALSEAVVRLLKDQSLRQHLASLGCEHAKRFSVRCHVQRLTEIYQMVADAH